MSVCRKITLLPGMAETGGVDIAGVDNGGVEFTKLN